jgi:hypothetical protein
MTDDMDIRTFFRAVSRTRTRTAAAANEAEDIATIIRAINTRTPAGVKILAAFKDRFGAEPTAARGRTGSNRGTHYDFEVEVNQSWKKVEHKGGQAYCRPNPDDAPWKAGVQFYNGGCEKYSLAQKYAQLWYAMYIESGSLREEFGITAPTPTFTEWFGKDCKAQDDPKTPFGKELKSVVRETRGPNASLREKRAAVLAALEVTDEDKAALIAEVLPIANHALDQKEQWLSIHGNLEGDFHAVWYPQFRIESIQDIVVEKNRDLELTFLCANSFTFHAILRWGKGAGFSNLRMDLK